MCEVDRPDAKADEFIHFHGVAHSGLSRFVTAVGPDPHVLSGVELGGCLQKIRWHKNVIEKSQTYFDAIFATLFDSSYQNLSYERSEHHQTERDPVVSRTIRGVKVSVTDVNEIIQTYA
jgi:hypothetical protein